MDEMKDIQAELEALAAGWLDSLSPEQIARLETHLNANPTAADQLADRTPTVEPVLHTGVEHPPAEAWESVWENIESATARPITWLPRLLRLWQPLAAVAACLLMVGIWYFNREAAPAPWPVEWAREMEINDLQVFEGSMPFVLSAGNDGTISMIWVIEN